MLRAIISQATGDLEQPFSARQSMERNGGQRGNNKTSSPLKWKESSPGNKGNKNVVSGSFGDWENPHTFLSALQKVEAWIFSRIVESIWWQVITELFCSFVAFFMIANTNLKNGFHELILFPALSRL